MLRPRWSIGWKAIQAAVSRLTAHNVAKQTLTAVIVTNTRMEMQSINAQCCRLQGVINHPKRGSCGVRHSRHSMPVHRISFPEVKLKAMAMEELGACTVSSEIASDIRRRDKLRSNSRPLGRRSHCKVGSVAVMMFREGMQGP